MHVGGFRVIPPLCHNRGSRGTSVGSITLWLLYPIGREPLVSVEYGLSGPQTQCHQFGEEKCLFPLSGVEPWLLQPFSLSTVLTAQDIHNIKYLEMAVRSETHGVCKV
jgi:hypothetical protein